MIVAILTGEAGNQPAISAGGKANPCLQRAT